MHRDLELQLRDEILKREKIYSFSDIRQRAQELRAIDGQVNDKLISDNWVHSFIARNPSLKALFPTCAAAERILQKSELDWWFEKFGGLLESVEPSLLANFDETMVAPSKRKWKAVVPSDARSVVLSISNDPNHITLCPFIFADGNALIPSVILPLQYAPQLPPDLYTRFHWAGTAKGWITDDIFKEIIEKIFIPEIAKRREAMHFEDKKAILLLDSHGSRFQECISKLLSDNNIEMLTIPAHSSHVLQPLDRITFSLFKSELQKLKHKYNFEKPILEK